MACLRARSARRPDGILRPYINILISPLRLDVDSCSFCEHQFDTLARRISSESLVRPPIVFPREPPGLGMTKARGSCRRIIDLWRLHMLHRVTSYRFKFLHTLLGLLASIAAPPLPITASHVFRFARSAGACGRVEHD